MTPTLLPASVSISHPIQPVHGHGYILIFLDRMHLLFTQVHFLFWQLGRVGGQYSTMFSSFEYLFFWRWSPLKTETIYLNKFLPMIFIQKVLGIPWLNFHNQIQRDSSLVLPMVQETGVQSQVKSNQRLKKMVLQKPPCLALNTIRWGSRVKWNNPGNGVAPSPTPWCSSYWKGSLWVSLD